MMNSVFIANDGLSCVCGTPTKTGVHVTGFARVDFPDETVANGVIVNESAVAETFGRLQDALGTRIKRASLVVDSGSMIIKRLKRPALSGKKLAAFIESEFSTLEHPVIDYAELSDGDLLCAAAERELIGGYASLFKDIGVKIDSIEPAAGALVEIAQTHPAFQSNSCILCQLDGDCMNAMLVINGAYRLMNRTRLFEERGTISSVQEITRLLSSLLQFNSTDKAAVPVAVVYLCGLNPNEVVLQKTLYDERKISFTDADNTVKDALGSVKKKSSLCAEISAELGIKALQLPELETVRGADGFVLADYVCNIGNMMGR